MLGDAPVGRRDETQWIQVMGPVTHANSRLRIVKQVLSIVALAAQWRLGAVVAGFGGLRNVAGVDV